MLHGRPKNLLAGSTCWAHPHPCHAVSDEHGFPVAVLREYCWAYAPGWPGYGPDVRRSFLRTPPDRPWIIHLAEGTDAVARAELARLEAIGCLAPTSVLVPAVGLRQPDVQRVHGRHAASVWSPATPHALPGRNTAPPPLPPTPPPAFAPR